MDERPGRHDGGPAVVGGDRTPGRSGTLALLSWVLAGVLLAGPVAGAVVGGTNATVTPGATAEVPVDLESAPEGISGYNVSVTAANPNVATVQNASYPDTFSMTSEPRLGDESVHLKAVDIGRNVESGSSDVELATVVVRGESPGETTLRVSVHQLDDDGGNPIDARPRAATIEVGDGAGGGATSVLEGGGNISPITIILVGLVLVLGIRYLLARGD